MAYPTAPDGRVMFVIDILFPTTKLATDVVARLVQQVDGLAIWA
jgi:hypothetical protein